MAKTPIEWTSRLRADGTQMPGFTFNPWWGCTRISPACDRCYADSIAKRFGYKIWGSDAERRFFGDEHWAQPRKWNEAAKRLNEQHLVFCASMADVGEKRPDLDAERAKLWRLIEETPHLIWLLLTKRPGPLGRAVPWGSRWPANVWLGVTVETPAYLWRIDEALEHPARIHFVSYEPALERIDFGERLGKGKIDWLIIGSESGAGARPTPLAWVRHAIDQARRAGAAPFVKQLDSGLLGLGRRGTAVKQIDLLPPEFRIREFPI